MLHIFRQHWPIVMIVLLAIVLRVPLLNGSFWMDEAAQALESARPWSEQFQIKDDFQPPLLHLITAVAIRVNQEEWWLRVWGALLPGIVTIIFTYAIGLELGKNTKATANNTSQTGLMIGSLAALLLATSSFHIFYSQELRQYSLPAFIASFSWWVLLKQRRHLLNSKRWWVWGVGWSTLSLLGLYSSYLYPFLLLAQVIFVFTQSLVSCRKQLHSKSTFPTRELITSYLCPLLPWITLILLIILGFLPWLPSFLKQLSAGQLVRTTLPGWEAVVSTPQLKALLLVGGKFLYGILDLQLNPMYLFFSFLIVLLLMVVIWQRRTLKNNADKYAVFLLLTWLLVPLLSVWLVSFVVPVLQPKRVLYLLPAWYLLISYLISPLLLHAKQKLSKVPALALYLIVLLLNLFATREYWSNPVLQRENWRQAWLDIDQKYGVATPKLFLFDGPFASWEWYDEKYTYLSVINDFSFFGEKTATPTNAQLLVNWSTAGYSQPRVLYFDYLTDLTDPQRLVIQELERQGYQQTDLLDYPNIGFIRLFEKAASEPVAVQHLPLYY